MTIKAALTKLVRLESSVLYGKHSVVRDISQIYRRWLQTTKCMRETLSASNFCTDVSKCCFSSIEDSTVQTEATSFLCFPIKIKQFSCVHQIIPLIITICTIIQIQSRQYIVRVQEKLETCQLLNNFITLKCFCNESCFI